MIEKIVLPISFPLHPVADGSTHPVGEPRGVLSYNLAVRGQGGRATPPAAESALFRREGEGSLRGEVRGRRGRNLAGRVYPVRSPVVPPAAHLGGNPAPRGRGRNLAGRVYPVRSPVVPPAARRPPAGSLRCGVRHVARRSPARYIRAPRPRLPRTSPRRQPSFSPLAGAHSAAGGVALPPCPRPARLFSFVNCSRF